MKAFRRQLLATAAGLTIAFSGVALAQAQPKKPSGPLPLATVTQQYHTKDSKALAGLEARMNAEKPAGAPRIVYVDPDIMSTWLTSGGAVKNYGSMIVDYLSAKNTPLPSAQTLAGVASASIAQVPGSAVPQLTNPALTGEQLAKTACIIAPYDPNMPANAYMTRAFMLANPRTGQGFEGITGMKLNISFTRQEMEEIVNAREAWGCFDTKFVTQVNVTRDFDQLMALHRSEVFKDIGGLMQAVKDGAGTDAIAKYADFRETLAAVTAHPRGQLFTPADVAFYGSVIYDTGPALTELKARIDAMGVDRFRALSGEEMVKMANDITEKTSLGNAEATHITGFSMLGAGYFRSLEISGANPSAIDGAKAAVSAALKRQNDAFERSLTRMTPEEAAGQMVPLLTQDGLYEYLQRQIFGDPGVKKNPEDASARLHVRQELIDQTRALMDAHPDQAGVIQQVLHGIFRSNPMMEKAPPPKPAPSPNAPKLVEA